MGAFPEPWAVTVTIVIQTRLFEFEEGSWTGRVAAVNGDEVVVQVGEESFPLVLPGAIEHQTVQGVWLVSANQRRPVTLPDVPPGKNLVEWLLGVLPETLETGPPQANEHGWSVRVREGLEEVEVGIVQVAPARWQISLQDLQGCAPLVWLSTPDRTFLRSTYHTILGPLEMVEGITILKKA